MKIIKQEDVPKQDFDEGLIPTPEVKQFIKDIMELKCCCASCISGLAGEDLK